MIMPMKEATLKVVFVTKSARKPPKVESSAEARIAVGAENVRNSNNKTANSKTKASTKTMSRSRKDFICSA